MPISAPQQSLGAAHEDERLRWLNLGAVSALLGLIALSLAWELWLAPLRPGGSWLVMKALPLLAPLFGLLRARRYTHRWVTLLALVYLLEGLVRSTSDADSLSRALAWGESGLAVMLLTCAALFARGLRRG